MFENIIVQYDPDWGGIGSSKTPVAYKDLPPDSIPLLIKDPYSYFSEDPTPLPDCVVWTKWNSLYDKLNPEKYKVYDKIVYVVPNAFSTMLDARATLSQDKWVDFTRDMFHGYIDSNGNLGYFTGPVYETISNGYMTEGIREALGCFYCDDCEDWVESGHNHSYDDDRYDDDRGRHNVYEYHSMERKDKSTSEGWLCGIEIEKEDGVVEYDNEKIYRRWGWCLEEDGSLDEETGFEAVSPIFSLFDRETIDKHLTELSYIVNAEYTSACGGHIHISHTDIPNDKVFDMLSPYFPLLFAMYPSRIGGSYSEAMPKEHMKAAGKYASVALQNTTVEIRIFPSPRSVKTLQWRLDLIRIMVSVEKATSIEMMVNQMFDINSTLFKHLTLVYKTPAKYIALLNKVIAMVAEFESVDLRRANAVKRLEKLLYRKFNNKKKEDVTVCV